MGVLVRTATFHTKSTHRRVQFSNPVELGMICERGLSESDDDVDVVADEFERRAFRSKKPRGAKNLLDMKPLSRKQTCPRPVHDERCAHLHEDGRPVAGNRSALFSVRAAMKAQSRAQRSRNPRKHDSERSKVSEELGRVHVCDGAAVGCKQRLVHNGECSWKVVPPGRRSVCLV